MNTAAHEYPRIVNVEVTDRWITAGFSDGRQISLPFNYKEVASGKKLQQNIELKPGDTVVVP